MDDPGPRGRSGFAGRGLQYTLNTHGTARMRTIPRPFGERDRGSTRSHDTNQSQSRTPVPGASGTSPPHPGTKSRSCGAPVVLGRAGSTGTRVQCHLRPKTTPRSRTPRWFQDRIGRSRTTRAVPGSSMGSRTVEAGAFHCFQDRSGFQDRCAVRERPWSHEVRCRD